MREIKFRAWDDDAEIMLYSEIEEGDYFWQIQPTLQCGFVTEPKGGDQFTPPEPDVIFLDKFMQFTGLKDKNGKEIYEGDIIKDMIHEGNGVVEFGKGTYDSGYYEYQGFYIKTPNVYFDWEKYQEEEGYEEDATGGRLFDCEVIGNIYENKELING